MILGCEGTWVCEAIVEEELSVGSLTVVDGELLPCGEVTLGQTPTALAFFITVSGVLKGGK